MWTVIYITNNRAQAETLKTILTEEGILADIHYLLTGKKKENINDIASYYKFMVIMSWENIDICVDKIINKKEHVKLYTNPAEIDTENVFIVIGLPSLLIAPTVHS